jgi:hypothetical protein
MNDHAMTLASLHSAETNLSAEETAPLLVLHYAPHGEDGWYCEPCLPAAADPGDDNVTVYASGISDDGFTGYPVCMECEREHCWVLLEADDFMVARDQNALTFEVNVCAHGHLHDAYGRSYERAPELDDDREIAWVDPATPDDVVFTPTARLAGPNGEEA